MCDVIFECPLRLQSISVITNITGPSIFVRYTRELFITVNICVVKWSQNEAKNGNIFFRYSREIVITVIVTTEFDCTSTKKKRKTECGFRTKFWPYIALFYAVPSSSPALLKAQWTFGNVFFFAFTLLAKSSLVLTSKILLIPPFRHLRSHLCRLSVAQI